MGPDDDDTDENAGMAEDLPEPAETAEQRVTRLEAQAVLMRDENSQLQEALEAERKKQVPNRRRPPRRGPDIDEFLLPRPPDWEPPSVGPMGEWDASDPLPFRDVKPILMKPPRGFEGKHDDIEQFLGACTQYFETFRYHYRGMPSLMVGLAVSLLEGEAEDWWVHERGKYWYIPVDPGPHAAPDDNDDFNVGPRYRFPRWETFEELIREQFQDPAIELVHEKRMNEMKMGDQPAHMFFRKLEREAKLANRLADKTDRGLLVMAVWKGIPHGYGTAIANLGIAIPRGYEAWKEQVLIMYEQRERQKVFEQTQSIERYPEKRPSGGQKVIASKPTKLSKPKGEAKAQGPGPKWVPIHQTTHKGGGIPMDIDAKRTCQMAEGKCFRCDEKGHLSRDCPHKGEKREVRALESVPEPLAEMTEVKEVKE